MERDPRMGVSGAVAVGIVLLTAGAPSATVAPLSRNLGSYVMLARKSLQIKEFTFGVAGNLGVNDAGGRMYWGRQSFFPDGSQVVSDIVTRVGDHSSMWEFYANTVVNAGKGATIRNGGPLPFAPPVIATLPVLSPCTPGSTSVSLAKGGSLTLPPGNYGAVLVRNDAVLTLSGGTYCFASLKSGRRASILAAGTTHVDVAGIAKTNVGITIGPAPGSGLGAADFEIDVAGKQVNLGHHGKVTAIVYAPNALLRFGRGGFFRGQFVASLLRSDFGGSYTLEACGDGKVDPGEQCDAGTLNGAPGQCCTATCDFRPAGTPCSDGNACNGLEQCSGQGLCLAGTPLNCNDGNACTDDGCSPASGCTNVPVADNTPCHDGDVCNGNEICLGGTCTDQPDLNCNDGIPCTVDSCDPVNGCQHDVSACSCPGGTDAECDDHNVCDGIETCVNLDCVPGMPLTCDDGNDCTNDRCDPTAGCVADPAPDGTPCTDHSVCTQFDHCESGTCKTTPVSCNDGDACTVDTCDDVTGCANTPIPACSAAYCTLTQGAYGAPGGIANGPSGWVSTNPGVFPLSVGAPGTGLSLTLSNQASLIAFMPTGGTANVLCGNATPYPCPSDIVIGTPAQVLDASGSGSSGAGGGVFTGQTLALSISMKLSNSGFNPTGLSSLPLPSGPFCTCGADVVPHGPFQISSCVLGVAGTVGDLLSLANQALRGVSLPLIDPCLTYPDISSAVAAVNEGFDTCRSLCPCS